MSTRIAAIPTQESFFNLSWNLKLLSILKEHIERRFAMRNPVYRSHSTEKAGFLLTYKGSRYEVANTGSIRLLRKLAFGTLRGTVSLYICERVPPAPKRPKRQS